MPEDRAGAQAFDHRGFIVELNKLRARYGALAIKADVMLPVDADTHHVIAAESGATQLHLDILENDRRRRISDLLKTLVPQ